MVGTLDVDANQPWWGLPDGVPSPRYWFNLEPLNDGDVVAMFTFKGTPAPREFDPNISLTVTLNEGPPGHWTRTQPVDVFALGMRQLLRFDIDWKFVEPLFPGEAPIWTSMPQ